MATKTLSVQLNLDIKGFTKSFSQASKMVAQKTKQIGAQMSIAFTAPLALASATAVKLFDTQIKAENKLSSAIKANGGEVKSTLADYKAFASQIQAVSTVGDEATLGLLSVAQSMGVTGDNAKQATLEAIALGKAMGISESSAIRYTSALAGGDAQMLTRYLPALKGMKDKSAQVAKAHELLGKMLGSVTAEAREGLGPLTQLKNRFGDLLETFGDIISKGMQPFINAGNNVLEALEGLNAETRNTIVWVGALVGAIGPLFLGFSGLLTVLGLVGPAMLAIGGFIATILAPLGILAVSIITIIGVWDDLVLAGKMLWEKLSTLFSKGVNFILELFSKDLGETSTIFSDIWNAIIQGSKDFVVGTINTLMNLPRQIANLVLKKVRQALNGILKAYNWVLNKLKLSKVELIKPFEKFKDDYEITFGDVKDITATAMKDVKSSAKLAFDDMAGMAEKAGKKLADNFNKGLDKLGFSEIMKKAKALFAMNPSAGPDINSISTGLKPEGKAGAGAGGAGEPVFGAFDFDTDGKLSELESFAQAGDAIAQNFKSSWLGVFESFSQGFADAMATAIVEGESFTTIMKELWASLAKQAISMIAQILLKWVASQLIQKATEKAQAVGRITTAGALAFAGGVASMASAPFPLNLTAPAFGGAMQGLALSAMGQIAMKDGGITTGPTNALIGEAGQEAVIPLDKLDSMMGSREQTIIVDLDGKTITRAVIKNMPREVRLGSGVIM